MKKQKTFFICDRCQAAFEKNIETSVCFNGKFGFMKNIPFSVGIYFNRDSWLCAEDRIDLCPQCSDSFMKWWANGN